MPETSIEQPRPTVSPAPAPTSPSPFEPAELAIVLSHYDLGVIRSIAQFKRGSASTPKLLIRAENGAFVLKRRASGPDAPAQARFAHELQLKLSSAGFPLPQLLGTRSSKRSILELSGRIYELFRFIEGSRFTGSPAQCAASGWALALFHQMAAEVSAQQIRTAPSYHANPFTPSRLRTLDASKLPGSNPQRAVELGAILADVYERAAARVDELGLADWPRQTIHGDWHPGNMLFEGDRLAAVIDYETARTDVRCVDLASAALQCSMTASPGKPPHEWPAELNPNRFKATLTGYEQCMQQRSSTLLSTAELRALPDLMVESLIAEAAAPIAATGRFGGHDASNVLHMVQGKAKWILDNRERLATALD
ncbi:MAG: phosphotransferase [Phycisphaerales bacterium]